MCALHFQLEEIITEGKFVDTSGSESCYKLRQPKLVPGSVPHIHVSRRCS